MTATGGLLEALLGGNGTSATSSPAAVKAIIWARVSTDMQEARGLSMPEQLRQLREHAGKHGIESLGEFHEAASAYQKEAKRVEFHRMLAAAKANPEVNAILVHDFSRFSRDSVRAKALVRELRQSGIKVISLNDPDIDPESVAGVYMEAITFAKNEAYSREVAFHTRKGCRANVQTRDPETGWCYKNGGQPLFGYKSVQLVRGEEKRDFGDGGTSTQQNPSHEYTAVGRYAVSLTAVTDLGPDTETKQRCITVLFPDVLTDHWAWSQVISCVDANIVKGYDDGLYHPEYSVTRDQMAVYISRALAGGDSSIPAGPATPSFSDVPSNHWAYKHIEYAVSQNVVKGFEDGTYLPGVTVDRGTMAVYIARAMVAPGGDAAIPDPVPPATFPDAATTFWAYKQVEYCVSEGVVKGYDDGNYHPERPVTRDQMAVYIARAFGLL